MAAELADVARSVIDANSYMALGTGAQGGLRGTGDSPAPSRRVARGPARTRRAR
jgi:hypothetical protein